MEEEKEEARQAGDLPGHGHSVPHSSTSDRAPSLQGSWEQDRTLSRDPKPPQVTSQGDQACQASRSVMSAGGKEEKVKQLALQRCCLGDRWHRCQNLLRLWGSKGKSSKQAMLSPEMELIPPPVPLKMLSSSSRTCSVAPSGTVTSEMPP